MAESRQQCEENEQKSYEYRLDEIFNQFVFWNTHFLEHFNFTRKNLKTKGNVFSLYITVI